VDLSIDIRAKQPSYHQLADRLRAAIDAGEIPPNEAIPSFKTLIAETGLAMGTVQKAIRTLELENRVYTVSGRGTFVTPRNTGKPQD
jgi:DNA-binding GntR family transcriptional regulator